MKNNSNKFDKSLYIINYEVDDDKIVVHYTDNKTVIHKYSKEKVQELDSLMEKQISFLPKLKKNAIFKIAYNLVAYWLSALLCASFIAGVVSSLFPISILPLLFNCTMLFTVGKICFKKSFDSYFNGVYEYKDIKKIQYFLKNRNSINKFVKCRPVRAFEIFNKKSIKNVFGRNFTLVRKDTCDNESIVQGLSLNDISPIKISGMRRAVRSINRDDEDSNDRNNRDDENSKFVLCRKI